MWIAKMRPLEVSTALLNCALWWYHTDDDDDDGVAKTKRTRQSQSQPKNEEWALVCNFSRHWTLFDVCLHEIPAKTCADD